MPKYSVKTLWTIDIVRSYIVEAENAVLAEKLVGDTLEHDPDALEIETDGKSKPNFDAILGADEIH